MPWFSPAEPAQSLASLVLMSAAVMGSPGPATISVAASGSAFGIRRTIPYMAGLVVGTSAVLLAVAVGVGSAMATRPGVAQLLTYLSAAYVLYLAVRIATAPPLADAEAGQHAPSLASGFLLAIANPKAYVAIAAVFAGSRVAIATDGSEAIVKTLVLTGMIVFIHLAWLFAGSSLSSLLRRPFLSRMVNLAFSAMLLWSTIPLVIPDWP